MHSTPKNSSASFQKSLLLKMFFISFELNISICFQIGLLPDSHRFPGQPPWMPGLLSPVPRSGSPASHPGCARFVVALFFD